MAYKNDYDDLMANVEWEDSEIDSGYFDSDNEAGNSCPVKTGPILNDQPVFSCS